MAVPPSERLGFPALAKLMSLYPEAAQFRSFSELNMLSLLRLQAELQDLEVKFKEIQAEDAASSHPDLSLYGQDFRLMRDCKERGKDALQYDTLVSIGDKLATYHEALERSRRIATFAHPAREDWKALQKWLVGPSMGNQFLNEREKLIWTDENSHDLVTLMNHNHQDPFAMLLRDNLLKWYHALWGYRKASAEHGQEHTTLRWYGHAGLDKFSRSLVAVLSSLLPTLAILVLYFINQLIIRIGVVIIFTSLFSLVLTIFTEARKSEIFAATAAFAAVEVVFIGSSTP